MQTHTVKQAYWS